MRVLVVEDERKMAEVLRRGLTRAGLAVDVCDEGGAALLRAGSTEYDAIVLDAMLPDLDGLDVCRRLRADRVWSPVLMLTARAEVPDRVDGLDAGADDYLAKPFAFDELLARLRALARRGPVERAPVLEVGDLRLDPARHRAWRGSEQLDLSAKELALLEIFMRAPGEGGGASRAERQGAGAAGDLHAPSGAGAEPVHAAGARLGGAVREPLERRRRLRASAAREDRPAVRPRV